MTAEGKFFEALQSGQNPLSYPDQGGFKFPILMLYRSLLEENLHYPFYGHQTNLDNLERIDSNAMVESSDLLLSIIGELERNELS